MKSTIASHPDRPAESGLARRVAKRRPRPSTCQVCRHDERWRLELLRAGGAGLDALAEKFDVSRDSVHRHWNLHVTPQMKASYLCGPAQLLQLGEKAAEEG